jgi:hypothetical protein
MYCPKCSAQNNGEQKYCRRCGLPLTTVQLALEGRADEVIAKYKKGRGSISSSVVILSLTVIGALINIILVPGPWNLYLATLNLVLGLLTALPMIIFGYTRLWQADRLLSSKEQSPRMIDEQSRQIDGSLSAAAITDSLLSRPLTPHSVTERTTLNLGIPKGDR